MEEWDIISPKDVIGSEQLLAEKTRSLASAALPFTQSLLSQVPSPSINLPYTVSFTFYESLLTHLFHLCSGGPHSDQSPASLQLVLRRRDQAFQASAERRWVSQLPQRTGPVDTTWGTPTAHLPWWCGLFTAQGGVPVFLSALHSTNPVFCRVPNKQIYLKKKSYIHI